MKKNKYPKFYYNIHNILGVESNVEILPECFKGRPETIDLVIKKGGVEFEPNKYNKLGLKYYGGEDKLFLEYKAYGKPLQKLLIEDVKKERTKLYFTDLTYKIFAIDYIIDFLIEIKLLQKGYTFVHAGCLTKGKKGFLLAAWSEMGKSSTVFGLAKKDFGVLSDDKVILSREGILYSFPEAAGVFFHSKNIENLNLSLRDKAQIIFNYILSKIFPLSLYVSSDIRVDLSKLLRIQNKAELEKTYFLEWGRGVEKIDKKTAINKIISATGHAMYSSHFPRQVFLAYSYLNDFDTAFIEKGMENILENTLKDCEVIRSTNKDFYKYLLEKHGNTSSKEESING